MRRPRSKSALMTSASCGRRAIFRLPECTQSSGWPVSSVNASILRQASLMRLIIRSLLRAQLTMPAARGEVCDPISCLSMRTTLRPFAFAQVVRRGSAEAAGANDDHIRLANHDAHARGIDK